MIHWRTLTAVFIGGGFGATCRYVVGALFLQRFGPGFPYATLAINITGCFLIGIIAELALARSMSIPPPLRTFLVVGVIGGYTTFSTFAYDAIVLAEDSAALIPALVYVCASVVGGILAAFAGMVLVRSVA